jgi:two-component system response regulator YesN
MDEAVNLLENTEDKSYVIANRVGYEEPTYFSYVFKKQFGVSPAKYRQTLGQDHETKA